MSSSIRGLNTFITDIRHCSNKEAESNRVHKELSKIRSKFYSPKGLSGYHRKKYVWKLLYIYILGYEVDFGQKEAALLINSPKFSEKYTGYVASSVLLSEKSTELFETMAASVRNDLHSVNEIHQSLALAMIGAQAPIELVEVVKSSVIELALNENSKSSKFVRKKALLCLLRIYRKFTEIFDVSSWGVACSELFDQKNHLGYLSAASSFVLGVSQLASPDLFQNAVPAIIKVLQRLVIYRDCTQDYLYYSTPNPWLQIKLLKVLQMYPPPEDSTIMGSLIEILSKIIKKTEVTKMVNKNNADHGILFEAAYLIILYKNGIPQELRSETISLLSIFITVREPNIRYLALETLCKLFHSGASEAEYQLTNEYLPTILNSLRDNDISIRRQTLDLLYLMCSPSTASSIVEKLLTYAEEADLLFKEEVVLKLALLAERFAQDLQWYINVVTNLVSSSGDFVTDEIWFRIIQIIIGFGKDHQTPELQKYAANKMYSELAAAHVHENLVKIASVIICELSHYIINGNRDSFKIFETLNKHFIQVSEGTKAILLTSFAKLANKHPELIDSVQSVFEQNSEHFDPDIQQRSIEYNQMFYEEEETRKTVLTQMPPFSEELQNHNPLIKKLYKMKVGKEKDQTLLNSTKKQADQALEGFKSKSALTSANLTAMKSHPVFPSIESKIALRGANIYDPSEPLSLSEGAGNLNQIKSLLTTPNGNLYENEDLVVQYKSEFQGYMGRIAMQFDGKAGPLENVSLLVGNAVGMLFNISPVKYGPQAQVMMQVMSTDPTQTIPVVGLFYNCGATQKKVDFALPVLNNKFFSGAEVSAEKFRELFSEYTNSSNANYHKMDFLLKNPAGPSVPLPEVMKKVGALLNNGLGFKVIAVPDMQNVTELLASANFVFKKESEVLNYPVIVNAEAFEEHKDVLRFSLRAGGNGDILKNLEKVISFYLK